MRLRIRTVVLCSTLAVLARSREPKPAPKSPEGLASMLGNAVGGTVLRSDIAWEPSSGVLAELLHGRRILFLANHGGEGARDLYRARVRLTLDARPVSIASVRNLTTTPFGDEHMLVVFREYAALAIRSYGRIGQVTILDLMARPALAKRVR